MKSKKNKAAAASGGDEGPSKEQQKEHARRQKVAAERQAKINEERARSSVAPFVDSAATDENHQGKTGADKARALRRPRTEVHPNPPPNVPAGDLKDAAEAEQDRGEAAAEEPAGVGPAINKGTHTKRKARK